MPDRAFLLMRDTAIETVVSLGTDLVANLTEKLSRETKVEPGRVTFPAVVRHNLNLVYQAIHCLPDPTPEPALEEETKVEENELETAEASEDK